jgi:hypothetical protein
MSKNKILLALMLTTTIASASTSGVDHSVANLSAQHTAAIAFQLNAPDVVDYKDSRFTASQVIDAANSFSRYANEDVVELNKKIQTLHDIGMTLDYTSANITPDSSPDEVYTFMFNSVIELLRDARNGFTEDSVVASDYVAKTVVASDYVEKTAHDSALLAATSGNTFSTLEALRADTSADNKYDSVKDMIDQGVKSLEETAAIAKDKIDNPPATPTATKTRAEIIEDLVSQLGPRAQRIERIALNAMDAGTFEAEYGAFTS